METSDDNLPPVQAPNAGFLMQLFVVPMVIVVVIVAVCLMFNWLAHLGTQPQDLVDDLSKLNAGSWQKALTIANMLTDRQHAELRRNAEMAEQLATVLEAQLQEVDSSPERIKLRVYLCMALGVFEVPEGTSVLVQAATQQREPADIEVRLTALEAIARRLDHSAELNAQLRADPALMEALKDASRQYEEVPGMPDAHVRLRERAAFVYGVMGGPEALDQLAGLLSDREPTVRYNAATGLARHGDERAVARLVEMLQEPQHSISDNPTLDQFTRATIIRNALRATVQLAENNPQADLRELKAAIDQLVANDGSVSNSIALDAKLTAQKLK